MAFPEGYNQAEVLGKIAKLEAASRASDQSGLKTPFDGFASEFADRIQAVLLPHPGSDFLKRYSERVSQPLQQIAEELGIDLLIAGIHYPFHITLCDMKPSEDNMPLGLSEDYELQQFQDLGKVWDGVNLSLSRIIPMASNGVILASDIPPEIARAREIIPAVLSVSGNYPDPSQDMSNICHTTLYRITQSVTPELLTEFNTRIRKLNAQIAENNLEMNSPCFYMGPSVNTFGREIIQKMRVIL